MKTRSLHLLTPATACTAQSLHGSKVRVALSPRVCVSVCNCVCVCVCVTVCLSVCLCICLNVSVCVFVYLFKCVCLSICLSVCIVFLNHGMNQLCCCYAAAFMGLTLPRAPWLGPSCLSLSLSLLLLLLCACRFACKDCCCAVSWVFPHCHREIKGVCVGMRACVCVCLRVLPLSHTSHTHTLHLYPS